MNRVLTTLLSALIGVFVPLASCAQTQLEMDEQAQVEAQQTDSQLNEVYKRIASTLEGEDLNRLKTAERAWVHYRDANCAAEAGLYEGGSIVPTIQQACLAKLTRERTDELRRVYFEQLRSDDTEGPSSADPDPAAQGNGRPATSP